MSTSTPDCVFCKIVAGDIPAEVLGRTEHAIAFRDLNPQAPFHVLVAPLDHHENAAASAAADPASIGHLVALADEVAQGSGNADYRIVANTGAGAGQTVFHTHLHVLGGSSALTESLV
jgi:histidine triad (HIT) family protein